SITRCSVFLLPRKVTGHLPRSGERREWRKLFVVPVARRSSPAVCQDFARKHRRSLDAKCRALPWPFLTRLFSVVVRDSGVAKPPTNCWQLTNSCHGKCGRVSDKFQRSENRGFMYDRVVGLVARSWQEDCTS